MRKNKEPASPVPTRGAPAWHAPEPRALPALREEMCDQLRNPLQLGEMAHFLAEGRGTINPELRNPERAAVLLADDEHRRLQDARLCSISAQLGDIAVQAGRKLPSWTVRRDDVPKGSGLMVYDEPIAQYVTAPVRGVAERQTVSIVAVSWGPSRLLRSQTDQLWVTFWSVVDHDNITEQYRTLGLSAREARAAAYAQKTSDLNWDNEVHLTFDSNKIILQGSDEPIDPSGQHLASVTTASWIQTVRATWLLLKPSSAKIVETEEVPLSRTVRRRAERHGMNSDAVTVARVHSSRRTARRRTTSPEPAQDGNAYSVRFPVSGHVRWQPYPKRGVIEPIWIESFDKGPEDAPYRVGKNYTVHRLDQLPPAP